MRSRNSPPTWLTKARLNNDMYAVPTCGSPVGEGATRRRTPPSLTGRHPIGQGTDALDLDTHGVTYFDGTDPGWCPGEDHVSGQQGHEGGDVRDQLGNPTEQQRGARRLPQLTVDPTLDGDVGCVELCLYPRADGTEAVEALGACPLGIAALQVARRDVVRTGVAEHRLQGPLDGHLANQPADHDRELGLVVHLAGQHGIRDGVVRPDDGRRRLEEDDGLVGHLVAKLCRVVRIVAPEPDDLARENGGHQANVDERQLEPAQAELAERVTVDDGDQLFPWLALDDTECLRPLDAEPCDSHAGQATGVASPRRSRPYSTASSRASHEAAMTFSCTPTVVHSRRPSLVSMSTRVTAPVPCLPSRMRTL